MNVTDKDLHWLAGLLEGEGSFMKGPPSKPNSPIISIEMKDEDIIDRVSKLFLRSYTLHESSNENWSKTYRVRLTGSRAVELMYILKPLMGIRRQVQIQLALDSYNSNLRNEVYTSRTRLTSEMLDSVRKKISEGFTLRFCARELGFHHETLRRRL